MSKSTLEPYPSTDVVAQVTGEEGFSPPVTDLVRAVYLTHFFGQNDRTLTGELARHTPQQVRLWSEEEQQDYLRTWENMVGFFRGGGSRKLAVVATAGALLAAGELEGLNALHAKSIEWSLQAVWRNRVDPRELRHGELTPTYLRRRPQRAGAGLRARANAPHKPEGVPGFANIAGLGRLFMRVDAAATIQGRPAGSYVSEAHESMTREVVVAGRSSGLGVLDRIFQSFHEALPGAMELELAAVQAAWEAHHPGQGFYPGTNASPVEEGPASPLLIRHLLGTTLGLAK